jgi:hypothetical protein
VDFFTEELEEEPTDTPPKNENEIIIYKTSTKSVERDLTPFMKNYVDALSTVK